MSGGWVNRNSDAAVAATDAESRMGIEPLAQLHAERQRLTEQYAPLWARYGPGGTFDYLRKCELSRIANLVRAEATQRGDKITEAAISEAAHADDRYHAMLVSATEDREQLAQIEEQIRAIGERINRGQAVARAWAAEASSFGG